MLADAVSYSGDVSIVFFDSIEDTGIEDVKTSIDLIGNVFAWFFIECL
jgi:hypothetical protein